jgi:hypothetical protein
MKVYFDKTAPLYVVTAQSFDGVPVDMPEKMATLLHRLRAIIEEVEETIDFGGAPETSAQDWSNILGCKVHDAVQEYMT